MVLLLLSRPPNVRFNVNYPKDISHIHPENQCHHSYNTLGIQKANKRTKTEHSQSFNELNAHKNTSDMCLFGFPDCSQERVELPVLQVPEKSDVTSMECNKLFLLRNCK